MPAKLERGDIVVLVVDRSSTGHLDLSLTHPRMWLEVVNVQGREDEKF